MATEPSPAPRRQLSAILFADVYGYSRLMARNEERTCQRVTQAIRLIRSLVGDYGGRVEHVAGDGILALFETAPQALQFAIAIQREFRNASRVAWRRRADRLSDRHQPRRGAARRRGQRAGAQRQCGGARPGPRARRRDLHYRSRAAGRAGHPRHPDPAPRAASTAPESPSRSRCLRSRSTARQRRSQPNRRRSRAIWSCLSRKRRSRSCRSKTSQAIRATAIFAMASPATSSPICRAFATCW